MNSMNTYPELDVEMMKRFYEEFGGLFHYRVMLFDEITKTNILQRATFNESVAKGLAQDYCKRGLKAWVESVIVQFDGAFAKKEKT